MPWYMWMSFLTVPVLVGVGCTLASKSPDDPNGFSTVIVVALIWLILAHHIKGRLMTYSPRKWVRHWMVCCVIAPIFVTFIASLKHDAGVRRIIESRLKACEQPDARGFAASAPSRRMPSWPESKKLIALVQPRAIEFCSKLFTAIPIAWWVIAFAIGIWRGD